MLLYKYFRPQDTHRLFLEILLTHEAFEDVCLPNILTGCCPSVHQFVVMVTVTKGVVAFVAPQA